MAPRRIRRSTAAEPGRDEYEDQSSRAARSKRDIPLLAICRGIQVLNVARGGTLIQHIPDEVGTTVNHRVPTPTHSIAHEVWIESQSMLERLMGERRSRPARRVRSSSRHHQAPMDLGEGLVASATAPDGVIEAIEDPGRRFASACEWHPENFWRT